MSSFFSKFLYKLILIPVASLAAIFSLYNSHDVMVHLWPLYHDVNAPLYLVVFGVFMIGIMVGYIAAKWPKKQQKKAKKIPLIAINSNVDNAENIKKLEFS